MKIKSKKKIKEENQCGDDHWTRERRKTQKQRETTTSARAYKDTKTQANKKGEQRKNKKGS